ncbi:MAG: hemerythrin family protein [Ignavibacteriaceae bacterium]|nr:hemerythrin family protein [Ignavibacteriaceae bacterium]
MNLIIWRDTYETGIPEVDRQHRSLVDITNELIGAHQKQTGRFIIYGILDRLVEYTKIHFSDEEKLFDTGYTGAVKHRQEHDYFILELDKLQQEAARNNLLLTYKTLDFLKDWLINHILGTDKELGTYIANKGK